jgi:hypothetical protein
MKTKQYSASRRSFLGNSLLLSAAVAFSQSTGFLGSRGWLESAESATLDLLHDTFDGLLAFVVPGSDSYSIAQGVDTPGVPGGIDAGVTDALIAMLDDTAPFLPSFSAQIAAALNGLAQAVTVNTRGSGNSVTQFSKLFFAEKVAVFQIMDATDELKLLAGLLPVLTAFLIYSEGGAYDPETHSLTAQPVGWQISNYQGVSDGRDEFKGYFANRRTAQ